ncbi:hypothetical protein, partial [Paenibacillus apiarius]|uniref:hypothetical protein n=1 Tax=Paenibacillus apiarius TaxID=46240 RepID=UPI003B3B1017
RLQARVSVSSKQWNESLCKLWRLASALALLAAKLSIFHLQKTTIGGELNKLAANIALGRDTAGVHWRSSRD